MSSNPVSFSFFGLASIPLRKVSSFPLPQKEAKPDSGNIDFVKIGVVAFAAFGALKLILNVSELISNHSSPPRGLPSVIGGACVDETISDQSGKTLNLTEQILLHDDEFDLVSSNPEFRKTAPSQKRESVTTLTKLMGNSSSSEKPIWIQSTREPSRSNTPSDQSDHMSDQVSSQGTPNLNSWILVQKNPIIDNYECVTSSHSEASACSDQWKIVQRNANPVLQETSSGAQSHISSKHSTSLGEGVREIEGRFPGKK